MLKLTLAPFTNKKQPNINQPKPVNVSLTLNEYYIYIWQVLTIFGHYFGYYYDVNNPQIK